MDITRPNKCTIALAASPCTADKIYNCFFTLLLQTFIESTRKILRVNISNLDIRSKIVAIVVVIIAKIFRFSLIQPEYADTLIIIVLTALIPYIAACSRIGRIKENTLTAKTHTNFNTVFCFNEESFLLHFCKIFTLSVNRRPYRNHKLHAHLF